MPHDLPIGLVDLDNSASSRLLARTLDNFDQSHIVAHYPSSLEARRAMQRNEIYGYFCIPKNFEKDANALCQPKLTLYMQYTYLLAGSLVYKDMKTTAALASASGLRNQLRAKGLPDDQAQFFLQPIVTDVHPTNNPQLNYAIYINNIIVPGILFLITFMLTVYIIGSEVKYRTAQHWLSTSNHSVLLALTAKLLPYTLLLFFMGCIIDTVFYTILQYPCNGPLIYMLFAMLITIIAAQAFGLFLFAVCPSLRLAMSISCLWGVISFSICGFTFPYMALYPSVKALSYLFPLRHYYLIYVTQALDGFSPIYAWQSYLALLCFILLPLPFLIRLKRNLIHIEYIP